MRYLVTFVCLAVIATAVTGFPAEVIEAEPQQLAAAETNAEALLDVDTETGHDNESDRLARQFGYGRRYGGYGGYGGYGRGGFGGGYGGYGRGYGGGYGRGYGGYGGYRGGFYG